MWDTIGGIVSAVLIAGFFGGLCFMLLFKSDSSNYPLGARGTGILLLAGILKVVCVILALDVSDVFEADWINYALGALAIAGFFVMAAGFDKGAE
jgi:hypothetical protein